MHVLQARNVNDALFAGLTLLKMHGEIRPSRNGDVISCPTPVTTVYQKPMERVLFEETRDANPFFHFFESLWMLAGRNDLAFVEKYAKNMRSYSDDGQTMWGAYGWRWRSFFEHDQIVWAISRLKKDPFDRRVVIGMWSASLDTGVADKGGKDVPCNLSIHLQLSSEKRLNMTVFNRSNDIIWGAYGANAVHMSFLQEYVAAHLGVEIGMYWQVSDNYHAYRELFDKLYPSVIVRQEYGRQRQPTPLSTSGMVGWDRDLQMFMKDCTAIGFTNKFFRKIAVPMEMAHRHYRGEEGEDRFLGALEILSQMPVGNDWRLACEEWITRRYKSWRSK